MPIVQLSLLSLLAASLRLAWWAFGVHVIESEGVYYARVGENIAAGRGLIGIHEMGLQLLYPPLYESLIASGVWLGMSSETAGRSVSLLFGSLLPVLAFLLGRKLYSARVGWMAGVLFAVHPLFIAISVAVLTESTYLILVLCAVYCVVHTVDLKSRAWTIGGAVALGLAYLCRPEGFVLAFALAGVVVATNLRRWRLAARHAALLLGVFAIFAVPYITFLYRQTGQVRFEAKTADGIRYALAEQAGKNIGEIYFAVDSNLVETGNSNTSDAYQLRTTKISLGQSARLIAKQSRRNFPHLLRALADVQLGQPFLGVLVALGLFATPWNVERLRHDLPLVTAASLTLLTFGTWPFFHDRFLFPVMPAALIWAGLGLDRFLVGLRSTAEALGFSRYPSAFAAVISLSLVVLLCVSSGIGIKTSDELSLAWSQLSDDKPVGLWLRQHSGGRHARIMDTGPTVAYYAGDVLVPFPWTDSATALRFVEHKGVAFVVLRDSDRGRRPFLDEWLQHPPPQLEFAASFPATSGQIRVYEWHGSAAPLRIEAP